MAPIATKNRAASREEVRLTQLSSCAGCAAKLPQAMLATLLRHTPAGSSRAQPEVLVGSDTFDDAGVYRLREDLAVVQTVDFFTPIVDDAFDYGQIAAANALSDVYAMGGRPVTALNILAVPPDKVPPRVVGRVLAGGLAKARQAGCAVLGGHTIRLPEPVYGMSVTGVVDPRHLLTNAKARPGDLLLLTKPLGTGITTTAIKRGVAPAALVRRAVRSMKQINLAGAELAERGLVHAATDVTGFGLMGHLGNVVRASLVAAHVAASDVPVFGEEIVSLAREDCVPGGTRSNLAHAEQLVDWGRTPAELRLVLCDAQTSGGLLLCVSEARLSAVRQVLAAHRAKGAVIGRIERGRPRIRVV